MNFKKAVIILLFSSALVTGIVLLFIGIKDSVSLAIKTMDWSDTAGYFSDCGVCDVDNDGKTVCTLKYVYYVEGTEYFVETEYKSKVIPEPGSVKTVLYEPENPKNAVIKGGTASATLLTVGFMFTFVPLFMIVCGLFVSGKIKVSVKLLDFTAGFLIFAVGELFIYVMSGSIFLWKAFGSMGFLAIIPSVMVIVGAIQMVKTVVNGVKKNER